MLNSILKGNGNAMDNLTLAEILNSEEITDEKLLETIDEVFATGANEIDPKEIFEDYPGDVPTEK